jgi:oligopeptide transport system ATP-binding protein
MSIGGGREMTVEDQVLLRVAGLKKHFPISRGVLWSKETGAVKAVDGISFDIHAGETLGLVGESGCGKSTTGRAILQLHRPTAGRVFFEDQELTAMHAAELRPLRLQMQMIFQDSYAALNPRHSVGKIIAEPLTIHDLGTKSEQKARVSELLEMVGLNPSYRKRFPHEFSGGQRQRIGIARALSVQPKFIVCDEPISALDVSIQAQITNLLQDLQAELGLTYLFIAHDLSMVRHISSRVAVMYLGKIVELASRDDIYNHPLHPYTQALMSAVPVPDPQVEQKRKRIILPGDPPSPSDPPPGCVFNTRCPIAEELCRQSEPEYREAESKHFVACHLAL